MEKIGRYEIERELAQGGMGLIYLARDPYVQRQVVVKLLIYRRTLDETYREFFKQEAELIAALEHPCIAPIYDFGWLNEQPYIVMRYMAGGSLEDKLQKEKTLPPAEIGRVISRVAAALDAAHARQIVHRDVKPSNFLYDSSGEVFLSDFGVAKSKPFTDDEGEWLIGTPAYMCPEMIRGEKTDGRADVYALGVTLYRLLTGELPFRADSNTSLINAHIERPIPDLRALKQNLPAAWQEVVVKAMAKNPAERYQTAGEFAREVAQIAAGKWFLRKLK